MRIKAVFFDIDGTLIDDHQIVSKSTIKAINELKKQGILVGLATGRGPSFLKSYMVALGIDVAVAYNGQYIFSRHEVISATPISKKNLKKIVDYAISNKKDLSLGTSTEIIGSRALHLGTGRWTYYILNHLPHAVKTWLSHSASHIISFLFPQSERMLLKLLKQPIYQVVMLSAVSEFLNLEHKFPELKLTRSSSFAVDFINRGMSKLRGIQLVGKTYKFDLSEVIAFGDSDNDIEMLSGVGHGVAMGNGSDDVKKVASHVTSSNNQDGIYQALVHLNIIKETSLVQK